MANIHHLVLAVVDEDEHPKSEISARIKAADEVYPRVLKHEMRNTEIAEFQAINHRRLTCEEFEEWFYGHRPDRMTSQTIISLINVMPEKMPGRSWLVDNIVPSLLRGQPNTAIMMILHNATMVFGESATPILVQVVLHALLDMLDPVPTVQEVELSSAPSPEVKAREQANDSDKANDRDELPKAVNENSGG